MNERLSCVSSRVTASNGGPAYLVINTDRMFDKGDPYHAALGRPSFKTSTTTEKSARQFEFCLLDSVEAELTSISVGSGDQSRVDICYPHLR